MPTEWKPATVCLINKERGIKQVATNYWPSSLLGILPKGLEKSIFRRLYSHLDPFLPSHQFGFRQKDSTAYQLSHLINEIASALDEGHTTLPCFYYLSKAFDRVWHRGLLAVPLRCTRPSPRLDYKLSLRPPPMCQTQWLRLTLACSTCWCAPGFCAWPSSLPGIHNRLAELHGSSDKLRSVSRRHGPDNRQPITHRMRRPPAEVGRCHICVAFRLEVSRQRGQDSVDGVHKTPFLLRLCNQAQWQLGASALPQTCGGQPTSSRCSSKWPESCIS